MAEDSGKEWHHTTGYTYVSLKAYIWLFRVG